MARIIHVLPERARRRNWIIRTEGVSDLTLGSEEQAHDLGRVMAKQIANNTGAPIILRKWLRHGAYADEIFKPDTEVLTHCVASRRVRMA